MNTFKKISGFGAALVLASSMGSAFAADADLTKTRSQDRVREELNLQTPDTEQAQDRVREQKMDRLHEADGDGKQAKIIQQKKAQVRNEYKYKGRSESRQGGVGSGAMTRQSR